MAEDLYIHSRVCNACDLRQGQLPRKGHAICRKHVATKQRASGVVDVGLGGDMQLHFRPQALDFGH